jgi:hypothetical protein
MRSSRAQKTLRRQPRKCRSHTTMVRILSDVAERTHSQLIDFAGVRCFDERQTINGSRSDISRFSRATISAVHHGLALNGLNTGTPSRLKSSSFLVATIRSNLRAVAAIIPSSIRWSDLPCISRPHSRNEAVSIGRIWYEASNSSTHRSISMAFAGSWRRVSSIPACNSPIVTAERNTCSSRKPVSQATTAPWGLGFRVSETTLVSNRYRLT